MDDNVYIAELLDCYRCLLTDKQSDIMSLYYEEDLSLSEITDHYNVTRQAVLDNIKRSTKQLKNYEEKLRLVRKKNQHTEHIATIKKLCLEICNKDVALKIIEVVRKMED